MTLQPRILVLDEPTSQLDPQAAEEVLDSLVKLNQDLGLTIILSEHRLERVVQYVDRVLYLPGDAQPPILDEPRSVLEQVPLTPPLISLAKGLNWSPLPLTIKEGRRFARNLPRSKARSPVPDWQASGIPSSRTPAKTPRSRGDATWSPSQISVSVESLGFSYNGHPALQEICLEIRQGEFVALMGRNGSGKTTLLKQLVGLLKPDKGEVRIADHDGVRSINTRKAPLEEIIEVVGYVPQDPNALLFNDTVQQELDFTRRGHYLPPTTNSDLLHALNLGKHANSYPRDLSVGERQRVALAAILVAEPQILLLDEPTRGLDYKQKADLVEILRAEKARGRTILMATHDVELVASCADRVVLLGDGEVVVDGPVRQVMSESLVFASQINKLFRDPAFLTVGDALELLAH
jgi:energy-coupling factor transport system ATP-binding protein